MSHYKIKVAGQATDSSGNVSVSLNDISDISISSASTDQVLKYNGSNFVNSALTVAKGYDLKCAIYQGSGGSNYTVTTSNTYKYVVGDYSVYRINGNTYNTYNDTGFTVNNATSANSPLSNNTWVESIDIPSAGTYLVSATGVCRDNDITYQIEGNNGAISAKIFCDRDSFFGALAVGIVTVSSTDIVRLVVKAVTGNVVFSSKTDQDFFTFNILKLT